MKAKYARLILDWHRRFGIEKAHEKYSKESFLKYKRALEEFIQRWEEHPDPELVNEIAHCQLSGTFEVFFCEPVPASILQLYDMELLHLHREGISLGQIAKLILHSQDSNADEGGMQTKELFDLPSGWDQSPVLQKPCSKVIRQRTVVDAVRSEFGGTLGKLQAHGLGGTSLMVALHESAIHIHSKSETRRMGNELANFTVYSPASFGLQLASGPGTLVGAMMSGRVRVGKVLVGVKADWAIDHRKESDHGHNRRD